MKWIAILLAAPLLAQTVYLRTPNTGYCKVTAATNVTPVRLTVDNVALCGITTNGQVIIVAEIRGNRAANIHLESAADTANFARKVSNLSGNSFDLLNLADAPVPGSGVYLSGGRVGLATAYTLTPHPRLLLDGPTGTITTSISSPTGHANPSNIAFTALKSTVDAYVSSYGSAWGADAEVNPGHKTVASALRWKADGNTGARTAALWGLDNIDQLLGTPACLETVRQCGSSGSSVVDHQSLFADSWAQAYSIMRDEMTPTARTNFANFILNDLPWTQGGFGYTGTALTKPAWKVRDTPPTYTSGTVTLSGTSVTGVGTSFLTTAAVGDMIMIPHPEESVYAGTYLITGVSTDTSLTVARGGSATGHYAIGPRWNASMYGWSWTSKHFDNAIMCGGTINGVDCQADYGVNAGLYQSGDGNHFLTRLTGYISMGLATCGDDPRGCLLLSLANELFVDEAVPVSMTTFSGFSQSSPGYHAGRTYTMVSQMNTMLKLSTGLDYLASTDIVRKGAMWQIGGYLPTLGVFTPFAENAGPYYVNTDHIRPGLLAMHSAPSTNEAKYMKDWLFNRWGSYNTGNINAGGGTYAWFNFLYNNPAVSGLTPPTSFLFNETSRTQCIAQYGAANCPDGKGRFFATSVQNWNADRTYLAMSGESYWCADHCQNNALGGWLLVAKGGKVLIGGDNDNYLGGRENRPYVFVGSGDPFQDYPNVGTVVPLRTAGDDTFMLSAYSLAGTYKPAAGVTTAEKQVLHLKSGSQDYILDHVRMATSSATAIRGNQQFHLNGCGTPSITSCVSISKAGMAASNTQTGAKLSSKALGLNGSNVRIDTETGSETNGSYAGGAGRAFKWFVCPTSDGSSCTNSTAAEWVVVHKPSTSAGDTMPDINQTSAGAFRILEIRDPVSPKLVAFAPASSNTSTSLSFVATHTGTAQFVAAGFAPGTWTFSVNGTPVSGCGTLTVVAGGHAANCDAVPAGTLTLALVGAPVDITSTSPLASGTVGSPYSVTLTAEGGTGTYTWSVQSGTLCAGLSLSGAGVVSGTPTTAQTCTFTPQATDGASATDPSPPALQITITAPAASNASSYRGTFAGSIK